MESGSLKKVSREPVLSFSTHMNEKRIDHIFDLQRIHDDNIIRLGETIVLKVSVDKE